MRYYYEAVGEPPGQWAGKGAAVLGLAGDVDPKVIKRLFHEDVGPGGDRLAARDRAMYQSRDVAKAVQAYKAAHPFATPQEIYQAETAAKAGNRKTRPYFDLTLTADESVSLLHVSLVVAARQARENGGEDLAGVLDAQATAIEQAMLDTARFVVREVEAEAAYTRTGYHSASTGMWRKALGVTAALFLQHTSHAGDPHLHVHITVQNRVQLADRSDSKYRTLDSRTLFRERIGLAALADKQMETRLTALGWPMRMRADGNFAEVDGARIKEMFSSRTTAIRPEVQKKIDEYRQHHGAEPNDRTLWLIKEAVAAEHRASINKQAREARQAGQKTAAGLSPAEQLADWEARTTRTEVQALSSVHGDVREAAQARAGRATPCWTTPRNAGPRGSPSPKCNSTALPGPPPS